MPRGRIVKPEVESLIQNVCIEHPNWKASEVRNTVISELKANAEYDEFWPIPKGWPSLSKVQKVLAPVREKLRQGSPLDNPWSVSVGIAEGVEISNEALPFVLATWVFMKDAWDHDLTIREARWLGRLQGIAKAILTNLGPNASIEARADAMEPLLRLVCLYAADERIAKLTGKQGSSVTLDFILWKLGTGIAERPELTEKIFPDKQQRWLQTEKGWLFKITKKEEAYMRRVWKQLGFTLADFNEVNQRLSISFEVDETVAKKSTKRADVETVEGKTKT